MSRVGKYPVTIPAGVTVVINDNTVTATGNLGELSCSFDASHDAVRVSPLSDSKQSRALWGTTRANINTMIKGVSEGFTRNLELLGVGYKARVEGTKLILSLGYSHDVIFPAPEGVKSACPSATNISISGADKQLVGQVAAEIREFRKPEPYKGKGIRKEGEYVRRKEGKKK